MTQSYYSLGKIHTGQGQWNVDFKEDACYEVIGTHSFVDGQDVTGLYELQKQYLWECDGEWDNCTDAGYDHQSDRLRRIIAIPLPTDAKEDEFCNCEKPLSDVNNFCWNCNKSPIYENNSRSFKS